LKKFDVSLVIPAYNEGRSIEKTLKLIEQIDDLKIEVLIVVDSEKDSTLKSANKLKKRNTKLMVQTYGGGPSNAIRFGIDHSKADCIVVMMSDGSDDARVIPQLVNLIDRGVAVACASRYMSGGQQIGGPRLKKFLSRTAGKILFTFAGIGTHDPTNSFKAYSKEFIKSVDIESRSGFEIGIELISKAHRMNLPIAEIPTIWLDRSTGSSNFRLFKWLPDYMHWFFFCFGPNFKGEKI